MTKVCCRCGQEKRLCEFYTASAGAFGRQSGCMECYRKAARDRAAEKRLTHRPSTNTTPLDFRPGRVFGPADLVVCPICSLRGAHECIGLATTGIGQWGWA